MDVELPYDLDKAKRITISELDRQCKAAIVGGFWSGALGEQHFYPSQHTDQINLLGQLTEANSSETPEGTLFEFTCVTAEHVDDEDWPMVNHTKSQINEVGRDYKRWLLAQRAQLKILKTQVRESKTVPEARKITWKNGIPKHNAQGKKPTVDIAANLKLL